MLKLIHNNKDHSNVSELLPWYVNQTLTQSEHASVEKHVRVCEVCQQEIKMLQSTFKAANDFDAAVIPCDERFNAIMQRIERTDESQASPNSRQPSKKPTTPAWYQQPQMAIAASFLGAMLMLYWASPLFTGILNDDSGDYQVLTSADSEATQIKVSFVNSTSKDDAHRILTAVDDRFTISGKHPDYTFTLPTDYDVIKISKLVKNLNSKNTITNVNIVREN